MLNYLIIFSNVDLKVVFFEIIYLLFALLLKYLSNRNPKILSFYFLLKVLQSYRFYSYIYYLFEFMFVFGERNQLQLFYVLSVCIFLFPSGSPLELTVLFYLANITLRLYLFEFAGEKC